MNEIGFSLEKNIDNYILKLQGGDFWELNIHFTRTEINSLSEIHNTDWTTRKTIKAGKSANSFVFWSVENDTTTIMVGDDDETWDFAVNIPTKLIEEIYNEA